MRSAGSSEEDQVLLRTALDSSRDLPADLSGTTVSPSRPPRES